MMLYKFIKVLLPVLSLLLLVYMLMPGPSQISDFPALPESIKSNLEGDTIQVPNVSAYFSDNFRYFVTPFYKQGYQALTKFPFLPLTLNHPPEFAYTAIKDQTQSTYLEEYTYPLRDSLFVNGLELVNEDGTPRFKGGGPFLIDGEHLKTKVTLRFYPSNFWVRVATWLGINMSAIALYLVGRRILRYD
jgi:hypothetical protein